MDSFDIRNHLLEMEASLIAKRYKVNGLSVDIKQDGVMGYLSYANELTEESQAKFFHEDTASEAIVKMQYHISSLPNISENAPSFIKQQLSDLAARAEDFGCDSIFVNSLRETAERLATNILEKPKGDDDVIQF